VKITLKLFKEGLLLSDRGGSGGTTGTQSNNTMVRVKRTLSKKIILGKKLMAG
jgi:hypothetical protein